ncbi:hypothetical protein [Sulfitobacter sp. R18_1]|uniref:hypothetical protein n=1 Tax=Sulfitobacter sp. R18_1 TaxID=2821104 RepID=UPI001ADBB824|nr:hypothetical protein [Sulfitobacter sp. R18_1]MBO9427963.1 hypothetical protein [Sulfitobacter sp. R18_1]
MTLLDRFFGPKKYISVVYTDETQRNLRNWCLDHGIDLTVNYDGSSIPAEKFVFHTTLMLTKSRHKHVLNRDVPVRACMEQIDLARFGKDGAGLGLRITSKQLDRMRRIFEVNHHMVDTWSTFDPHISLSYSHPGQIPSEIPKFPLVLKSLTVEDVCPSKNLFSSFKLKDADRSMAGAHPA